MISSSSISSPHIFVSQIELVFILNSFISLDWLHLINLPPSEAREGYNKVGPCFEITGGWTMDLMVLVLSVCIRGGWPQAKRGQGGRGEASVRVASSVTVSRVITASSGLLDVHPQPVDLSRGCGEVTL